MNHLNTATPDCPYIALGFGGTMEGKWGVPPLISHLLADLRAHDPRCEAERFFFTPLIYPELAVPHDCRRDKGVHEALEMVLGDPGRDVVVFGWSRGAILANVLANRLAEAGRRVRFLGLLDPVGTYYVRFPTRIPDSVGAGAIAYKTPREENLIWRDNIFGSTELSRPPSVDSGEFAFVHHSFDHRYLPPVRFLLDRAGRAGLEFGADVMSAVESWAGFVQTG